jgi:hypothetical protein
LPYFDFFWTDEIIEHLAEHDITPQDFERVVMRPVDVDKSESSDRETAFGYTQDKGFIDRLVLGEGDQVKTAGS